jgi:hypothetical protein
MDDMTQLCVDIASLKTLYEKPQGKTHTKKRVQYDIYNELSIRETLPLILANLKVNSYQCPQHIRNVEYDRLWEYLCKIITILSLQMFICPYYLWNRTILVHKLLTNIALSITCFHLHNTNYIIFIDNDH